MPQDERAAGDVAEWRWRLMAVEERGIVMVAVASRGRALQFASQRLRVGIATSCSPLGIAAF